MLLPESRRVAQWISRRSWSSAIRALIWDAKRRFMSSSALFAATRAYESAVTVMTNIPITVTSSMSVKPLSSLRSRWRSARTRVTSVSRDAECWKTVVLRPLGLDLGGRFRLRRELGLGCRLLPW